MPLERRPMYCRQRSPLQPSVGRDIVPHDTKVVSKPSVPIFVQPSKSWEKHAKIYTDDSTVLAVRAIVNHETCQAFAFRL